MALKTHVIARFIALALLCCLFWSTSSISGTEHTDPARDNMLVFGYLPEVFYNVDPRDVTGLMEVWARMSERKAKGGLKSFSIVYKTIAEAEKDLANRRVDVLVMIPEDFIRLRAKFHLEPILSADYGNHFYNELLLLVREDSGIKRVEQLRGKSLLLDVGQQGSIPMKWLDSLLSARLSSTARAVFGTMKECTKSSQAIMPVFFRQADACLVSRSHYETMVELNPQLGRQLRILESSPGFVTGILATRKDLKKSTQDAIINNLQEMYTDPKGKQIMTVFRIKRLVPFKADHLASVEKIIREHRGKPDGAALRIH
ncbi:MAG: PhnD/SsuA/transferrin family substrate-binding protein [Desulfuromonadales bacterium]|nr:PhnD/SsuA/transferrin family substrate-binding protein [Desulfuromonadales bacterium]